MQLADIKHSARRQCSTCLIEHEPEILDMFQDQAARDQVGTKLAEVPRLSNITEPKLDVLILHFRLSNGLHLFGEIERQDSIRTLSKPGRILAGTCPQL